MTMFPLMLGLLAILGLVVRDPGVMAKAQSTLLGGFRANAHEELAQVLKGAQKGSGMLGIISIVGLLWCGTVRFVALEFALGEMFGAKQRDFAPQCLMA